MSVACLHDAFWLGHLRYCGCKFVSSVAAWRHRRRRPLHRQCELQMTYPHTLLSVVHINWQLACNSACAYLHLGVQLGCHSSTDTLTSHG